MTAAVSPQDSICSQRQLKPSAGASFAEVLVEQSVNVRDDASLIHGGMLRTNLLAAMLDERRVVVDVQHG
jgi:hypothetical protein